MAGSATATKRRSADGMKVTWAWTADASGDVSSEGTFSADGYLVQVDFIPGTAADDYDVTLLDSEDKDILRGDGANQQNAAGNTYDTKYRMFTMVDGNYFFGISDSLTPTIANGGNLGTGTIVFKFSRTQP